MLKRILILSGVVGLLAGILAAPASADVHHRRHHHRRPVVIVRHHRRHHR